MQYMQSQLEETVEPENLQPTVEAIAGLPCLKSLKFKGKGPYASVVDPSPV